MKITFIFAFLFIQTVYLVKLCFVYDDGGVCMYLNIVCFRIYFHCPNAKMQLY